MKKSRRNKMLISRRWLRVALGLLAGCGTIIGNPVEDDGETTAVVYPAPLPVLTGINLAGLTKPTLPLLGESTCADDLSTSGLLGLVLGTACHTTSIVNGVSYGTAPDRNADGQITCDDYGVGDKEQGILLPLLCDAEVIDRQAIETLRFEAEQYDVGISFADFANGTPEALGSWTPRGEDEGRYPAKIRLWRAPVGEAPLPVLALDLASATSGRVYLDFAIDDVVPICGDVRFSVAPANATAYACRRQPSDAACHFQDINLRGAEPWDEKNLVPPGYRLRLLADDATSPAFVLFEGKFRFTAAAAASTFKDLPAAFLTVRETYYRMISKEGQFWASFDLKDESGTTISSIVGEGASAIDLGAAFKAGFCQNLGSDQWVTCDKVDPVDYISAWVGDNDLDVPSGAYQWPFSAGDAPQETFPAP